MQKKKKYNCTVCNTQWECYVYTEFSTPFSVCLYCLMDIESAFRRLPASNNTCTLCDTNKDCHRIILSNNPVQNEIQICNDCFSKIKNLMKEKK